VKNKRRREVFLSLANDPKPVIASQGVRWLTISSLNQNFDLVCLKHPQA